MSIANNNIVARVAAVVAGLGLVASSFVAFAPAANAQSSASLEAQIQALMAQIAALQAQAGGSASVNASFNRDLTIGASGADVTALQNWLISMGFTIPAGATGYFGGQTQAALAKYQASVGITPAAGYFGPITRAKVNASAGGSTGGNTGGNTGGSTGGDLEGGAGSIDETDLVSSLNSEEVGEDEEDVEVAGLEIEVDDGSDIELTAVRLAFAQSADAADDGSDDEHQDFEDYATEVSIWLDGEEFARVDADEFEDDSDFEKTLSLDGGAIIRAGEMGELTVAISGANNLDSGDIGDVWTVDFEQVRFRDADGATITETVTEDPREFSFVDFATAADVELHISEGEDDVNDSRSIETDDTDVTDDVELMSFELEAEGDSDIEIKQFGVNLDASTGSSTSMVSDLRLVIDGEEFSGDYEAGAADGDNWVFDDVDFVIDAGDTVEAMIVADIEGTDDFDSASASLSVSFTSDEESLVDAEDESGEDLGTSDITGSANAGPFVFGESGITVEAVSTDADANDGETVGTFEIVVDVTAYGDDLYIYNGADDAAGTTVGLVYTVYGNGTATTSFTTLGDLVTSTADKVNTNWYEVQEGETEKFTLTVTVDPQTGGGGIYNVELDTIYFSEDASGNANAGTSYSIPSSEDVETAGQNLIAS